MRKKSLDQVLAKYKQLAEQSGPIPPDEVMPHRRPDDGAVPLDARTADFVSRANVVIDEIAAALGSDVYDARRSAAVPPFGVGSTLVGLWLRHTNALKSTEPYNSLGARVFIYFAYDTKDTIRVVVEWPRKVLRPGAASTLTYPPLAPEGWTIDKIRTAMAHALDDVFNCRDYDDLS
ncbi:hypothetical protein [Sorangium sp. So ce1182]|uniref:hypothetical protein n=1 Tax=Sorangium sp. So ce1182 TaxID=3133334 RepID=UPI003F601DFB